MARFLRSSLALGRPMPRRLELRSPNGVHRGAGAVTIEHDADLIRRFDFEMEAIYVHAKAIGYNATRFLVMIREHGGLEAAHRLLQSSDVSHGFAELWARGQQELTVEALALRREFATLFSPTELATARARLGR
jgi:hypothetical protein